MQEGKDISEIHTRKCLFKKVSFRLYYNAEAPELSLFLAVHTKQCRKVHLKADENFLDSSAISFLKVEESGLVT